MQALSLKPSSTSKNATLSAFDSPVIDDRYVGSAEQEIVGQSDVDVHSLACPKIILFDWDNTLVDTWDLIFHAMNHVFNAFGMLPWTKEEVQMRCHKSAREAFSELFLEKAEDATKVFYEYVNENHLKQLALLDNSLELLRVLRQQNIKVGIVSNKNKDVLVKEIHFLHLENYFDTIIGSGDADKDKPDPSPIFMALDCIAAQSDTDEERNRNPNDIWYVGDAPTDYLAAIQANILPIIISDLEMPDLQNRQKPIRFNTLFDLICKIQVLTQID